MASRAEDWGEVVVWCSLRGLTLTPLYNPGGSNLAQHPLRVGFLLMAVGYGEADGLALSLDCVQDAALYSNLYTVRAALGDVASAFGP